MSLNTTTKFSFIIVLFGLLISSCAPAATATATETSTSLPKIATTEVITPSETVEPSQTPSLVPSITLTETDTPTRTQTVTVTSTPDLRLNPADWENWPVVPAVSANAKAIYAQGLSTGSHADRFSKVGDCQNITTYFLAIFDNPDQHRLGPDYDYLQDAIDHFSGSFSRESIATSGGMNVASVLSSRWNDKDLCESLESPLVCELRLHQPSIVLISMEETWGSQNKIENYEKYMRQIIETVIQSGAVPVLATKAHNLEGDQQINKVVAQLAYEYDIPMWNFWLAVQPLPSHGLLEDGFHLTHGLNYFDDPRNLKQAWPVRNLTALQVIDAVWRQLNDLPMYED